MSDGAGGVTEVYFYHLERRSLESVLPELLHRSLARGWRAVVQAGSEARLAALDANLWTYDEASFLPHGTTADGHAEEQPVWLTLGPDNPNGARARFLVDGAEPESFEALGAYDRVCLLFDGADPDAVQRARAAWQAAGAAGHEVAYWRQDESGRWRKEG